jgi:hypothetical protein
MIWRIYLVIEKEQLKSIHRLPRFTSLKKIPNDVLRASRSSPSLRRRPTPDEPMILSASEYATWLRCRVKHHWRHQLRLEPIEKPEPLAFGSLGHSIMQAYYGLQPNMRSVKAMTKIASLAVKNTEYSQLDTEARDLMQAMCVGYAAWAPDEDAAIGLKLGETELEFLLPLVPDGSIKVHGFIDVAFDVTNLKKTMGALEFKFKKSIQLDVVETNLQLSVYLWALKALYPKYKDYTVWYNILRKQMPGPRVKADLFAREGVTRSDEEIEQWKLDAGRIALDMIDAAIYPNPTDQCSWDCDFKMACLSRGNPDLPLMIREKYRIRPERKYETR